jgi:aryl-alcohol dehydrogenase-like predicted oxidoreductase
MARALVAWSREHGYRWCEVDTARVYQSGECEELIGEVLRALGSGEAAFVRVHTQS